MPDDTVLADDVIIDVIEVVTRLLLLFLNRLLHRKELFHMNHGFEGTAHKLHKFGYRRAAKNSSRIGICINNLFIEASPINKEATQVAKLLIFFPESFQGVMMNIAVFLDQDILNGIV